MGVFDKLNLGKLTALARGQEEMVYFPGCTTLKYLPDVAENYKTILSDLHLSVRTIEPFCCGRPLKEQGYTEEFEKHKAKIKARLEKEGVKTLVTNCASCMVTLKEEFGLDVRHTTEVIAEHKRKLQQFNRGEVAFQDNCIAARELGQAQSARDVLVQTGFKVNEFAECKKGVRCCGGSCGLPNNAGSVAVKLAQRRLRDAPANIIVTDDPHCYIQLKRNTQNKDVLELSETLIEI
jgi:Fe-S oxidoreductase